MFFNEGATSITSSAQFPKINFDVDVVVWKTLSELLEFSAVNRCLVVESTHPIAALKLLNDFIVVIRYQMWVNEVLHKVTSN